MARMLVSSRNMRGKTPTHKGDMPAKSKNSKKVQNILERQNKVIQANFGVNTNIDQRTDIANKAKSAIPLANNTDDPNTHLIGAEESVAKKKTAPAKKKAATSRKKSIAKKTKAKSASKKAAAKKTTAKKTTAKTTARKKPAATKKTAVKKTASKTTSSKNKARTKATPKKRVAKKPAQKTKATARSKAKSTVARKKPSQRAKQPDLFSGDEKAERIQKRPVGISAIKQSEIAAANVETGTAPLPRSAAVQLYKPNGFFSQVGYWFRQYSRRMLKPVRPNRNRAIQNGKRKIKAHEMLDELNRLAAENKALRAKLAEINGA